MHRINRYPLGSVYVLLTFIRWIAICPLDSVIQHSGNRGLSLMFCKSQSLQSLETSFVVSSVKFRETIDSVGRLLSLQARYR